MAGLIDGRIKLLFLAFLVLLFAGAARAGYLGAVQSARLSRVATSQQVAQVTVPALRGAIVDRTGKELAVTEQADDVAATPYLVKDPGRVARELAPILGQPAEAILPKLVRRDTGFVYLAHQVPATRAARVMRIKTDGLELIPKGRRVYPMTWTASQVLGWVGSDGHGLAGLEYSQDRALRGQDGARRVVKDALGQPIAMSDTKTTVPGQSVKLTIDAAIQQKVESVLRGVGQVYRPKAATAIVMDPRSGSVLALANWPRVDANNVAGSPAAARQNLAVGMTYEPGSTFKAFTVAGALQEGLVTPTTPFFLPVSLQYYDRTIHDAEARGPETLQVQQILKFSSNVGADLIGRKLGADHFSQWVRAFGFGKPTGVDLPGEEQGITLPRSRYSGSSMGNLPIGQGEAVTPMQMATAYAAIANGGILRPAHVVRSVGGKKVAAPKGHRVISATVAASLRTMLQGVFADGGTAHDAQIQGYDLAGKTGTANKPDPIHGGYSNTQYVASFMGFVPTRAPKLLVAVVVDTPQGAIYGGSVAAPAFQKIVGFAVPYLGIDPK
ncbi:MAG: penicillin-binding protein 2 [Solirubrobacterales bacterium]|nr:penicillin-binding protein 2 [Solirubrobacterales bacterium]